MWIYDGEEWIEEGVGEREKKTHEAPEGEQLDYPELQIVEIPNMDRVPPPPMP